LKAEPENRSEVKRDRQRSRSPKNKPRESSVSRTEGSNFRGRYEDNDRFRDGKSSDISRSKRIKSEDDGILEIRRSGNFENWQTATIKTSKEDSNSGDCNNACNNNFAIPCSSISTVEDDIQRLHNRVAYHVMTNMNKYYSGSKECLPRFHKISSSEEFTEISRRLSHDLRDKIKESYKAYNKDELEGIRLTPDHVAFIENEVERFFEDKPLIVQFSNLFSNL